MSLAEKLKFKKWVFIATILSFVVLGVYLYLFSNIGEIVNVVKKTNLSIYTLAFLCVVASIIFNTLTWHKILDKLSIKTTFRRVFTLSWVGMFVDAIIPGGWTGDIFKAYMLSQDEGVDGLKAGASIVVKKVFETFASLVALVIGLTLLAFNFTLSNPIFLAIGLTMVLLSLPIVVILFLSLNLRVRQSVIKLAGKVYTLIKGKQDPEVIESKLKKSIEDFHDGVIIFKTNPKGMIQPLIFQMIAWSFDVLTLFVIFASLGYIVGPDKIIITNTIAVTLQAQGFAFAGIAMLLSSTVYSVLGIQSLVSISSSLLTAFPTFWFKVIISFIAFQMLVFNRGFPSLTPKALKLNPKPPTLIEKSSSNNLK
jgi:uncharacterized protein (TIRG00374 family)